MNILLAGNIIKKQLRLPLTPDEEQAEKSLKTAETG
jgi:hypothetical protein